MGAVWGCGSRCSAARGSRSRNFPTNIPVAPDANVYVLALPLSLVSGLLLGAVPVRQGLRTDPYQAIKLGVISSGARDEGENKRRHRGVTAA